MRNIKTSNHVRGRTLDCYFNSQQPSIVRRPITGAVFARSRQKPQTAHDSKLQNHEDSVEKTGSLSPSAKQSLRAAIRIISSRGGGKKSSRQSSPSFQQSFRMKDQLFV